MRVNSIKFEISVLYTLILGVILVIFSGVLYIISNTFFHQIDQTPMKAEAVVNIMQLLQNWLFSVAISVPLILLLTSFVGRILAARILEPVQKITEAAKRISSQDLSARIKAKHFDVEMKDLIEAFNDMIARLEHSFKHIEEFSYHVAHELKTPLTIIRGETELVLRKDRGVEDYKKSLRIISEEAERMLKTIEDLLLLTKLDYQPNIFKYETFDFLNFFKEIYEQSKAMATAKNIRVSLQAPHAHFMIHGDQLHLRRLFFNVIDNAIKFVPPAGRIDMAIMPGAEEIVTAIADTGPGIPAENLARIFEPFFRTDNNVMGNGLGLNIAQTIAQLHQGRIEVESTPGRGSTFKIILPLYHQN